MTTFTLCFTSVDINKVVDALPDYVTESERDEGKNWIRNSNFTVPLERQEEFKTWVSQFILKKEELPSRKLDQIITNSEGYLSEEKCEALAKDSLASWTPVIGKIHRFPTTFTLEDFMEEDPSCIAETDRILEDIPNNEGCGYSDGHFIVTELIPLNSQKPSKRSKVITFTELDAVIKKSKQKDEKK